MTWLDFISHLIWPALIAGALIYFRKEIKSAFSRIREVGPTGVKLDNAQEAVQQQTITTIPGPTVAEAISGFKQLISAEQLDLAVADLMRDLEARTQNLQERVQLATHAAAALNIQLTHERVYRLIFGSQLLAIVRANELGGVTEDGVKAIYDEAASRFPELYKDFTLEQWKAFLHRFRLVHFDSQKSLYVATPWGRGFLRYVVDQQLPVSKAY